MATTFSPFEKRKLRQNFFVSSVVLFIAMFFSSIDNVGYYYATFLCPIFLVSLVLLREFTYCRTKETKQKD